MTKTLKTNLLMASVLSLLAAGTALPSYAQGSPAPAQNAQRAQASREMRASQVIGVQVKNAKGDKLGKVEDLVIDIGSERLYYVLLSSGGLLGVGDKQFLFPVSAFRTGREADQLVLDVDKERLKKAPGFDPDRRPDLKAQNWRRDVDRYFKIAPGRQAPKDARMAGAASLQGVKVNDRSGQTEGKIADVVVNFGTGRAYPVLARESDGKLAALPFSALMFPDRPDLPALLTVDNQRIASARAFEQGKWPDLNAPEQQREIAAQLLSFQTQGKTNPAAARTGRQTGDGSAK